MGLTFSVEESLYLNRIIKADLLILRLFDLSLLFGLIWFFKLYVYMSLEGYCKL